MSVSYESYKKYSKLASNQRNVDLLSIFIKCEFKGIDFLTFDWVSATDDRNWWWQVQQLPFLKWYICSFDLLDEEQKLNNFNYVAKCLENWSIKAKDSGVSPLVWHDHASAFRLRHLLQFYLFLTVEFKSKLQLQAEIATLIDEHLLFLDQDSNYSCFTNHGFDQALEVYTVCLMLGEESNVKYKETAYNRLVIELEHAFTTQGVHKENSPSYQKYMITRLTAVKELATLGDSSLSEVAKKIVDKAQIFFECITLPDGSLPLIGDTKLEDKGEAYTIKLEKEVIDYSASGYVIVRGRLTSGKEFHFIVKSSHDSDYHRHDDDLSFHLYVNGEVIFGDGGLYLYNENDPIRKKIRSPLSHNTVYPSGYCAIRKLELLTQKPSIVIQDNMIITETSIYGGRLRRVINICDIQKGKLQFTDSWVKNEQGYDDLIVNFFITEPIKQKYTEGMVVLNTKSNNILITNNNSKHKFFVNNSELSNKFGVINNALTISSKFKKNQIAETEIDFDFASMPETDEVSDKIYDNLLKSIMASNLTHNQLFSIIDYLKKIPLDKKFSYLYVRALIKKSDIQNASDCFIKWNKEFKFTASQMFNCCLQILSNSKINDKHYFTILDRMIGAIESNDGTRFEPQLRKFFEHSSFKPIYKLISHHTRIFNIEKLKNGLVVLLPGAVGKKYIPYYSRATWSDDFKEKCVIAVADPALKGTAEDLVGAWFLQQDGSYLFELSLWLKKFIFENKCGPIKTVFAGSSMGGYAAFFLSIINRSTKFYSDCPQFNLLQHGVARRAVKDLLPNKRFEEISNLNFAIEYYGFLPSGLITCALSDVRHINYIHSLQLDIVNLDHIDSPSKLIFKIDHDIQKRSGHTAVDRESFTNNVNEVFSFFNSEVSTSKSKSKEYINGKK